MRKSIALTANTPFSQWGEVFVDAAMTVAAVDRLVHHLRISAIVDACFRLIVDGESTPSVTRWGSAQALGGM
jgi:DNA replication protein DnaC